jgi:ferrous iron transport protein B
MIQKVEMSQTISIQDKDQQISRLQNEKLAEKMEYTISGRIGKFLEPAFKPIGFDWKITTSSIAALAAKEVFVAQIGILYAEGEADEESDTLREKLVKHYTPLQAFCIMLFSLLSIPCLATLAIMRRELNSWKKMFAEAAGLFLLAYISTFLVYQICSLLQIGTAFPG